MPDARVPSSSRALEDTFARQALWWHILFAALVVVTAAIVTVGGGHRVPVQLGCIGTWALAYAVWGRRGLNPANRTAALAYLGCAWLCFLALFVTGGDGEQWILAFALYPQTWAMLPVREATLVTVVGGAATGLSTWAGVPHTQDAFASVVLTTLIMVALSVVLGLFIHRIIGEATARARAIDELHEARAQLVAAERDRGVHEERERLSREIHDTLAQGFTSVLALARAADAALGRGDIATARGRLDLVTATAAENLSEARLIVAELTPATCSPGPWSKRSSGSRQRCRPRPGSDAGCASRGHPSPSAATPRWSCCAPPRRRCPTCDGMPVPHRPTCSSPTARTRWSWRCSTTGAGWARATPRPPPRVPGPGSGSTESGLGPPSWAARSSCPASPEAAPGCG